MAPLWTKSGGISVVENAFAHYSRIYLGGIPSLIADESAFLAFICILSGIEALGNYCYRDKSPGSRFKKFVKSYFAKPYPEYADSLWKFRNSLVHAFSTGEFVLTHHNSFVHFETNRIDEHDANEKEKIILNAEDFYCALLMASQKFFAEVRNNGELKAHLIDRLKQEAGGQLRITPLRII